MRAMTYNILINSYSDISIRGGQIRYTVLPVVDIAVFHTTFFLQELLSIFTLCATPFSTLYSKVLQPLLNILQQSVAPFFNISQQSVAYFFNIFNILQFSYSGVVQIHGRHCGGVIICVLYFGGCSNTENNNKANE